MPSSRRRVESVWTYVPIKAERGERRTVPVNQTVMTLLKAKAKAKVRRLNTDLVFPSRTGTVIDPNHLRRATRLVQSGVDLYKVQRLLGHKSPMMTQRYPIITQKVCEMEWKP